MAVTKYAARGKEGGGLRAEIAGIPGEEPANKRVIHKYPKTAAPNSTGGPAVTAGGKAPERNHLYRLEKRR